MILPHVHRMTVLPRLRLVGVRTSKEQEHFRFVGMFEYEQHVDS